MAGRPSTPCTTPGCPGRAASGRCERCRATRRKDSDRRRGSAKERGYKGLWPARRLDYLTQHPLCLLCGRLAMIADHHPRSRRQLVAAGVLDPDADEHLRALCKPCHDKETARHQPGGWARERRR